LRRRDFAEAQRRGKRLTSRYSLLLVRKRADGGPARLGITVTRKVGNAVRRNRVKRLVREWFRQYAIDMGPCDVVVIAKRDIPSGLKAEELADDLTQTLTRAGYPVGARSSA
jgi:ribonuclease P protein component